MKSVQVKILNPKIGSHPDFPYQRMLPQAQQGLTYEPVLMSQ